MKTKMLKKNYEFKRVFEKKKYYGGKYLEIFVLENKTNENYLGIAISKKIANSVNRNRIKRLIRESFRKIENNISLVYNIVILWKKNIDIKYANYDNIYKDLENILLNAKLYIRDEI